MEKILYSLERQGYGKEHPDHDLLVELFVTIRDLRKTINPYFSNDPTKHRVNLNVRGRKLLFLVSQDDEYYLRKAAVLLNKNV